MRALQLLAVLAFVTPGAQTHAQQYPSARLAQFSPDPALESDPRIPLQVKVDLLQTVEMGITEETVRAMCTARLHEARFPLVADSSSGPANILYVNVDIGQDTATVTLAFAKLTVTQVGNERFGRRTTTWTRSAQGLHRGSADIALAGLRNALDQFVTEFLRANPGLLREELQNSSSDPSVERTP